LFSIIFAKIGIFDGKTVALHKIILVAPALLQLAAVAALPLRETTTDLSTHLSSFFFSADIQQEGVVFHLFLQRIVFYIELRDAVVGNRMSHTL
jgi:hypothetical protein